MTLSTNLPTLLAPWQIRQASQPFANSTAFTRGRLGCCARLISIAPTRSVKCGCSTSSRMATNFTASDIARALDLDAGYLSRLLRNFEKRGLISRKTSTKDGRQSHLALDPTRPQAFRSDGGTLAARRQRHARQAQTFATSPDRRSHDIDRNDAHRRTDGEYPTPSPAIRCAIRAPATSAGSFHAMPNSISRNTVGAIRSKASARRSSPISSTTSTQSASDAGSRS